MGAFSDLAQRERHPCVAQAFEFANAEALEGFLVDVSEYEEKKQVRSHFIPSNFHLVPSGTLRLLIANVETFFSITQRRMCLRINMPSSSAQWTISLEGRRSDAKVEDKDEKTEGGTARDIRLAHALEELFESALAAGGREYVPLVRPGREAKNGRGAERSYLVPSSLGEGELDIVRAHCLLTRHWDVYTHNAQFVVALGTESDKQYSSLSTHCVSHHYSCSFIRAVARLSSEYPLPT
jgi:hypothetical protein